MNERFIARLVVRLRGQNVPLTGTAYVISPHLLLTARHVVEPVEFEREGDVRIELGGSSANPLLSGTVHTPANESLDLALLEVGEEVGQGISPSSLLATGDWRGDDKFESMGFPKLDPDGAGDVVEQFSGKLRPSTGKEKQVVDVDQSATDWSGASGAPIFVGNQIVGIVRFHHAGWTSSRLHAIPSAAIWADEKLAGILRAVESQQGHAPQLRAEAASFLESRPQLQNALRDQLGSTDVVDRLCAPENLDAAVTAMLSVSDVDSLRAQVKTLVQIVVPTLLPWNELVDQLVHGERDSIRCKANDPILVEAALAHVHGRHCEYSVERKAGGLRIQGKGLIPLDLETGVDAADEGKLQDLRRHLVESQGIDLVEDEPLALHRLASFMGESDGGAASRVLRTAKSLELDRIAPNSDRNRHRHYVVLSTITDGREPTRLDELARRLKHRFGKTLDVIRADVEIQNDGQASIVIAMKKIHAD